jgi:hypothetical protein
MANKSDPTSVLCLGIDPGSKNFAYASVVCPDIWAKEPLNTLICEKEGYIRPIAGVSSQELRQFAVRALKRLKGLADESGARVVLVSIERFQYRPGGSSKGAENILLMIGVLADELEKSQSFFDVKLVTPATWKTWRSRKEENTNACERLGTESTVHEQDAMGMAVWRIANMIPEMHEWDWD